MGFWDFIWGRTEKIDHEFFGELAKVGKTDYYEGEFSFKLTGKNLIIGFYVDNNELSIAQEEFFKLVEDKLPELRHLLVDFGRKQTIIKDVITYDHFMSRAIPCYMCFPKCDKQPYIWDISFDSDIDQDKTYTFQMQDFTPAELHIH